MISCPCTVCGNLRKQPIVTVWAHLFINDMYLTYHTWIWYEERSTSTNNRDQVDISEPDSFIETPIDMVHTAYDKCDENPDQFMKLLEDAEKPLYLGCSGFTKLSIIVKLYNLKAKYSWSDKGFNELLQVLGEMFPFKNELPSSSYDAKKIMVAL